MPSFVTSPLNATTIPNLATFARVAAVQLTLGLFTIGSLPSAGHAFPGTMHWLGHLGAYALIAYAFGLGWRQRPAVQITAFVAVIGAIHETTEIITHNHAFETGDVIMNAIGALIGVAIQRAMQQTIAR